MPFMSRKKCSRVRAGQANISSSLDKNLVDFLCHPPYLQGRLIALNSLHYLYYIYTKACGLPPSLLLAFLNRGINANHRFQGYRRNTEPAEITRVYCTTHDVKY